MHPQFTNEFWRADCVALACPTCGQAYVHPMLEGVESHETDGYTCPLDTRGDWLAVPFWCEMCNDNDTADTKVAFRLVVGFHKGQTFVGTVVAE